MLKTITALLLPLVISIASALLFAGCASRNAKPASPLRPSVPVLYLEPGSTNVIIVPPDVAYGVFLTDRQFLYALDLLPE